MQFQFKNRLLASMRPAGHPDEWTQYRNDGIAPIRVSFVSDWQYRVSDARSKIASGIDRITRSSAKRKPDAPNKSRNILWAAVREKEEDAVRQFLSRCAETILPNGVMPNSLVQLRQFPSISLLPRSSPKRSPQAADLRGGLDFFSNFSSTYSFRTTALLCSASCEL